jgi:hypothetical protein
MPLSRGLALGLLLALLAGPLLVGRPAPRPARPPDLWGQVFGPAGPTAGATVRLQGTAVVTETDRHGRFRLPADPGARRVTAWKAGHLIAGTRLGASPLRLDLPPLPAEDHASYEWVDPAPAAGEPHNCGNCHAEMYREWSGSGHSRSADGRHFRNLYEGTDWSGRAGAGWGLVPEHPDGAGVCASCHAPALPDGDPALFDLRRLRGLARQGVHCDYCHKVAGVGDGTLGLTHGRFNLLLRRPREGQLFFGPLDDVDRGEDAYAPLYHRSLYCASCHEGVVFGVHVYSTYSEWLASPARREGKQCQDCHMAPTGAMTNLAPGHGGLERDPRTLGNHRFFDGSQAQMLRRCLRASAVLRREGGEVRAAVRLGAEGAGHRVPTGFIDRHLILAVEGRAADGRVLGPRRGPALPAAAGPELAGKPGRLYAKLLKDFDGRSPVPFWRADPDPADNRLTPGRDDMLAFVFPADLARLRVRVLYRRFWQEVARAKGWPDLDLVVLEQSFPAPP